MAKLFKEIGGIRIELWQNDGTAYYRVISSGQLPPNPPALANANLLRKAEAIAIQIAEAFGLSKQHWDLLEWQVDKEF